MKIILRQQAVHKGGYRHDKYARAQGVQFHQGSQAVGNDVLVGGKPVIRQGLPVREQQQPLPGPGRIEKSQFLHETVGAGLVRRDDYEQ